jgi:predicted transcriptional regulator
MGRPPLNVKPILVRLPDGIAERIDVLAGKNRRAEFIREAVEREIKRRERAQAQGRPAKKS